MRVVGIGELLWDLLPGGKQLGGAPANFVYHATALGADGRLITRIGRDDLGREALAQLKRLGVSLDCIELDESLPTGTVSVSFDEGKDARYEIHEHAAWDQIRGDGAAEASVLGASAICFGTLAQRSVTSRETIRHLLIKSPPEALRILDINLRQNYYSAELLVESLRLANVLKVNETELPILGELLGLNGNHRDGIQQLAERFQLRTVAFTRGGHGSLLFDRGRWSDHPGLKTNVSDTIGAGDSFTAAMTLGLLFDWDLDLINLRANQVASYVASCAGATPELPEELRAPYRSIK